MKRRVEDILINASEHLGLYIGAFDAQGMRVATAAEHLDNRVWTVNLFEPGGEAPQRAITVVELRAVIDELKRHGGETLIVCPADRAVEILDRFAKG